MSIISQDNTNELALVDCIQRFSEHHVGKHSEPAASSSVSKVLYRT